jgi:AcrR family transcriptional regulator
VNPQLINSIQTIGRGSSVPDDGATGVVVVRGLTRQPTPDIIRSIDRKGIQAVTAEPQTKTKILRAAKTSLLERGYAQLSTRSVAEEAGVPLSQIHYHFGSKQDLILEVLEDENRRLLDRQSRMFSEELPLWKRWEQACDFLEEDLDSGYVRVLQEMTAVGWSNEKVAAAVRQDLKGWFDLLASVAKEARILGPFTPREAAVLAGAPFLGVEALILLGFDERDLPMRSALRKVGDLIRGMEETDAG